MFEREAVDTTKTAGAEGSRRLACLAGGYLLFGIGLLGTIVPLLPTTVFWIAAAACFARSSPQMYRRILAWPRVGRAVDQFLRQGTIGAGGKVTALAGMTAGAAMIVYAAPGATPAAAALTVLGLSAAYVATRPSPLEARGER